MSLTIPQNPKELEPFLIKTLNDLSLDPIKLKRLLQILRKMGEASAEKKIVLSQFPIFEITPNALKAEDLNQLMIFLNHKPESTPYGRMRLWTYRFDAIVRGECASSSHIKALDAVIKVFFDALRAMNDYKEGRWKFVAYIDRNEVTLENAEKSGLFWHRDRFDDSTEEPAHYSLFFLLTDQSLWKSGELGLQLGGEKGKDGAWIQSKNPEIHILPRFNQAIVVKNSHSIHCVAPLIPNQAKIARDVFILTANFISK